MILAQWITVETDPLEVGGACREGEGVIIFFK